MHLPKWLIAAAGLLFVVLIAAVAFFAGRETSRPPAAATAASALPQTRAAAGDSGPETPTAPPSEGSDTIPSSMTRSVSRTPSSDATTPSASSPAANSTPAADEARARVAAYFKQMDLIQAGGAAGDPQEVATTVVNAATTGNFSGIDDLVRAAGDAERRAGAVQAPSECAEYHRQAMTLLQESRTMITALREGLKRNDADALTSVTASAQQLKSRAEHLAEAEKVLRVRFGL